jgi:outer membrane cobalamin receptor
MKKTSRLIFFLLSSIIFVSVSARSQPDVPPVPDDTTKTEPELPDSEDVDTIKPPMIPEDTAAEPVTYFSFTDSIAACFLNERFNLYEEAIRSFQHDAADFVRSEASNFIVQDQHVPHRTTVAPYSLPGDRTNVIFNNRSLSPLEHLPEPDNMIDFNDIPTTAVDDIYSVAGPLGMAFGGSGNLYSIVLIPNAPETTIAESRMVVDKGWYGYAYTKGALATRNSSGRSIRLAAGYRKADGFYTNSRDDAYHQWGEIIYPLNNKVRVNLSGRLYRRQGQYVFRPAVSSFYLDRFRRDRDLTAAVQIAHSSRRSSTLEFRHQRSEERIDRPLTLYYRDMDVYDNALAFSHDGNFGPVAVKASASVGEEKYKGAGLTDKRWRKALDLQLLTGDSATALLSIIRLEKSGGFGPAPSAALICSRDFGEKAFLSAALGYNTKLPRQYELYLVPRAGRFLSDSGPDYLESGNPDLKEERQLVGSLILGLGRIGNDLTISATGGKIFDGIDWACIDTTIYTLGHFMTINHDIEFASVSAKQRLSWKDFAHWSGGIAYNHLAAGDDKSLPYSPDLRAFSNLELHIYVRKLDLHLYGYGQGNYVSEYTGYTGQKLGDRATLDVKFSFRIKRFRFFYISQNVLNPIYESRERYQLAGRFNYYGVRWEFLN